MKKEHLLEIFLKSGFKMKNKKAILLPETLKIILAVIGISLLLYLSVNLYGLFTTKTDIEQARSSLDKLYSEIQEVDKSNEARSFSIQSPNDWWIIAWPYEKEEKKPDQCNNDYCICLCPKVSDINICQGIDIEEAFDECNTNGICKEVSTKVDTFDPKPLRTGLNEEVKKRSMEKCQISLPINIKSLTSLIIEKENNQIIVRKQE
jgi:hypothetical protein